MAIGAVSHFRLFLLAGWKGGSFGSRHSGHRKMIASRMPLCDGLRLLVAL